MIGLRSRIAVLLTTYNCVAWVDEQLLLVKDQLAADAVRPGQA